MPLENNKKKTKMMMLQTAKRPRPAQYAETTSRAGFLGGR